MIGQEGFERDEQFHRLMVRDPHIDLLVAALELARDAEPDLQFAHTLDWFDQQAALLKSAVARARTEREVLQIISRHLGQELGFTGDADCYDRPESSFLNRVVESRRGIPISLSLVYLGLADRVGIELAGVAAPSHFLTRCETVDGPVFVDAFDHGRLLSSDQCVGWLGQLTMLPATQIIPALKPVSARVIIIRMLNNLKVLYAREELWSAARRVQMRLTALRPGRYEEQRDLALVTARTRHTADAIRMLEQCLHVCPAADREFLQRELTATRKRQAQWN